MWIGPRKSEEENGRSANPGLRPDVTRATCCPTVVRRRTRTPGPEQVTGDGTAKRPGAGDEMNLFKYEVTEVGKVKLTEAPVPVC